MSPVTGGNSPADRGAGLRSVANGTTPPDDRRLSQLTATARRLAGDLPGPLHRIAVQLDGARIELEWAEGAPDRPGAAEAARPADGHRPAAPPAGEAGPAPDPPAAVVRSPLVGTFYRAAAPGEPPFVTAGTIVAPDTVIGIVEAMKLMNHITAEQHGTVRSVLPADGSAVEFDQPLVLLDPVAGDEDTGPGGGQP